MEAGEQPVRCSDRLEGWLGIAMLLALELIVGVVGVILVLVLGNAAYRGVSDLF